MAEHSSGPWEFADTSIVSADFCIAVIEDDGECAAPADERTSNGKLLAAAPDLLEALKGLLGGIERTLCTCDEAYTGRSLTDPSCIRCGVDLSSDDMDAARAAIAKATT